MQWHYAENECRSGQMVKLVARRWCPFPVPFHYLPVGMNSQIYYVFPVQGRVTALEPRLG